MWCRAASYASMSWPYKITLRYRLRLMHWFDISTSSAQQQSWRWKTELQFDIRAILGFHNWRGDKNRETRHFETEAWRLYCLLCMEERTKPCKCLYQLYTTRKKGIGLQGHRYQSSPWSYFCIIDWAAVVSGRPILPFLSSLMATSKRAPKRYAMPICFRC